MNSNYFEKKKAKLLSSFKEKKYDDVIKNGEKLLKKKNNDAQLIFLLVLSLINLQKFEDAERYLKNLISFKKTPELYYTYGNVQKKLKKYQDAIFSFNKAIELNPNFSEAYNNLGTTKKLINEREEAIICFKKSISLKKNNIEALINLATIYRENNNYEDLINIYNQILELDTKNIKTLYNLGTAYVFLGDNSKAKHYFERVFEIDKSHIASLRNYINITKIDKNNKIFQYLSKINFENLDYENKVFAFDALSKCYFDLRDYKLGFEYLKKLNILKKKNSNYSLATEKEKFKNIKSLFNDKDYFNINFEINTKIKPIFIIGMPRSGTTLLEQILSTHSQIHGAGELRHLPKIIDKVGLDTPKDAREYFTEIRSYYYNNLSKISEKPYIIDKLPSNFRWLGLILNSFPEAKIIHIDRNPMAVCWSNYKTNFVYSGMDYTLTQEDTADYYSLYYDLMKFWKDKFDKKFFNINYDDFVQKFEFHTKKILSYLNLEWEDNLKNYEKTNRVVITASYQQVRGKIRKDTSLEWKKYAEYLNPMQKILEKNKIKF